MPYSKIEIQFSKMKIKFQFLNGGIPFLWRKQGVGLHYRVNLHPPTLLISAVITIFFIHSYNHCSFLINFFYYFFYEVELF